MASRVLGVKNLSYGASLAFEPGKGTEVTQEVVFFIKMEEGGGDPNYDATVPQVESVLQAYGVRIGTKSADYEGIYVSEIAYEEVAPGLWEAKATYNNPAGEKGEGDDSNNPGGGGGGNPDQPWTQPPIYSWGADQETVAKLVDAEGRPLVNSYGDTFEGGVEFPIVIPTINIKWNALPGTYINSPMEHQRIYLNKVNEFDWNGWLPGQVLCRSLSVTLTSNQGVSYFEYEVELACKAWKARNCVFARNMGTDEGVYEEQLDVGWHKVIADLGPRYIDDTLGNSSVPRLEKTVAFKDSDGNPFVGFLNGYGGPHPMYQTGAGGTKGSGDPGIKPAGIRPENLPYFIAFDEYESAPLTAWLPRRL
jgi:hypothetical protein